MALLIVVVVGAALALGLSGGQSAASDCKANTKPVAHSVDIKGGKVSSADITGKMCDTITFTNEDAVAREIAFGPHEHHVPYDGVAERVLNKNESFTITLDKTGRYHWHDHLHDEVEGYFTVSK